MQRFGDLAKSLSENEDEISLLAMLLDDFYQDTFHGPVVPYEVQKSQVAVKAKHTPDRQGKRSRHGRR